MNSVFTPLLVSWDLGDRPDGVTEHHVAIHEAGHVVVRYWFGRATNTAYRSRSVSLDPPRTCFPKAKMRPDRRDDLQMRRRFDLELISRLGGPLAAARAGSPFDGGASDRVEVRGFLESYPRLARDVDFEVRSGVADEVLEIPVVWKAIEELADELQARRFIPWTPMRDFLRTALGV